VIEAVQPELGLVGEAGAPETPVSVEATDEILGEPSSSPTAVARALTVSASEPLSPRPATPMIEVAPITSPTRPAPQEHDAPRGTARGASLEIQEVGEG
jgi:hypothetical protein